MNEKDEILLKLQEKKMKDKVEQSKFESNDGKEEFRHHIVTNVFKDLTGQDMTDEQYNQNIIQFEKSERYNIKDFLKELGFAVVTKDWKSDDQIGKELNAILDEKMLIPKEKRCQ